VIRDKNTPDLLGAREMTHYHIRWSGNVPLDWQRFDTPAEAVAGAKQLVRFGETYTIEEHDASCSRCRALRVKADKSFTHAA